MEKFSLIVSVSMAEKLFREVFSPHCSFFSFFLSTNGKFIVTKISWNWFLPFLCFHFPNWTLLIKILLFLLRFQLNFSDHIKIILCPRMSAVTYIDNKFRTYKFSTISKQGCSAELYQKLRYAHEKLKKLLEKLKWPPQWVQQCRCFVHFQHDSHE